MAQRVAVYAGSFDPPTVGHVDIIERALKVFDKVVVAVGSNPAKRYLLDMEARVAVMKRVVADMENVQVDSFDGLLVDFCRRIGAGVIIRGLRAVKDFEFEFQTGLANRDMAPGVETVFLIPGPRYIFISSSLVKEIFLNGGDVRPYVPESSYQALLGVRERLLRQHGRI